MSRHPRNGGAPGPRPPHPAEPRGPVQADQSQQRVRLPPPSSLMHSPPSNSGNTCYPHHQPPKHPVAPQELSGSSSASPTSYPQPSGSATYHSVNHDINQYLRGFPESNQAFHAPFPAPRAGVDGLQDPRSSEAAYDRSHPQGPPYNARHGQERQNALNPPQPNIWQTQPPSQTPVNPQQPNARPAQPPLPPPSIVQKQPTANSSTPSSPAKAKPKTKFSSAIPNLVGGDKSQAVEGMKFHLTMRQQPKAARACGSGERDRRNIDPPPIIQLHVEAPLLAKDDIDKYLCYEGYVMNCWIYDETGTHDASRMPSEYRYQRRLTGSLVSTPFYGKDDNGQEGCFFPFSDLSVRTLGKYRLKFNLVMLDTTRLGQRGHFPILTEIFSDTFDVYTAKEFPGINESSQLVRMLREQGCIISIKKGNDRKKKYQYPGDLSDDEEEDIKYDGGGSSKGKRKRFLIED